MSTSSLLLLLFVLLLGVATAVGNGPSFTIAPSDEKQVMDEIDELQSELRAGLNDLIATFHDYISSSTTRISAYQQDILDTMQFLDPLIKRRNAANADLAALQNTLADNRTILSDIDGDIVRFVEQVAQLTSDRRDLATRLDEIVAKHQVEIARLDAIIKSARGDLFTSVQRGLDGIDTSVIHEDLVNGMDKQIGTSYDLRDKANKVLKSKVWWGNRLKAARLKLVDSLMKIRASVVKSMELWQKEEANGLAELDEQLMEVNGTVEDGQASRAQLAADIAAGEIEEQALQHAIQGYEGAVAEAHAHIKDTQAAIVTLQADMKEATATYKEEKAAIEGELEKSEELRWEFLDAVGSGDGGYCRIGAESCERCLHDVNCRSGQSCSDDGVCKGGGTTPPDYMATVGGK